MRLKKSVLIITILLIVTSLTLSAFADDRDTGNVGSGDAGGASGGGLVWLEQFSGYRFTIVDKDFKVVSNKVDLVFDDPYKVVKSQTDWYTNSRAEQPSVERNDYDYILINDIYAEGRDFYGEKYPPRPIIDKGGNNRQAQGELFKQWFLAGTGNTLPPSYRSTTSTGSGTGSGSGSKPKTDSGKTTPQPVIPDDSKRSIGSFQY